MAFLVSPLVTWLAIAALVAASYGAAYWKGREDGWDKRDEVAARQEREAARLAARIAGVRQTITEKVVVQYRGRVKVIENERIVPLKVSDLCQLSAGWVRLHDSAAGFPDTPERTHGAAEAIETVTDNYRACRLNAEQLNALQEWVSEQAKVK